jgi:hypothetical protein
MYFGRMPVIWLFKQAFYDGTGKLVSGNHFGYFRKDDCSTLHDPCSGKPIEINHLSHRNPVKYLEEKIKVIAAARAAGASAAGAGGGGASAAAGASAAGASAAGASAAGAGGGGASAADTTAELATALGMTPAQLKQQQDAMAAFQAKSSAKPPAKPPRKSRKTRRNRRY